MTDPTDDTEPERRGKWRDLSIEERIEKTEAEIARIQTRDEKRLIAAARKAGLFDVRFDRKQLAEIFETAIAERKPGPSTLRRYKDKLVPLGKSRRKDDARRKALLGGFLVAQCRHKPRLHARIVPDIRDYLEDHPEPSVAERNLALLDGFLEDPHHAGVDVGAIELTGQGIDAQEARMRTNRQILLGTWLLARRDSDPEIDRLIADELEGFLRVDDNTDRNRKLLADVLASE